MTESIKDRECWEKTKSTKSASVSENTISYNAPCAVYRLFYCTFFCPTKILFDKQKRKYFCVKASWMRQGICALINLFPLINTAISYAVDRGNHTRSTTLLFMLNIVYVSYIVWSICFIYLIWWKTSDVMNLFNELVIFDIKYLRTNGYTCSNRKLNETIIAWILIALTMIITTLDNFKGNLRFGKVQENEEENAMNILSHFKRCGIFTLQALGVYHQPQSPSNDGESSIKYTESVYYYFTGLTFFLTNTWRGICFTHIDLLITCWALQFRNIILHILRNFRNQIKDKKLTSMKKLLYIQQYLQFAAMIEKFNEVNGILVLSTMVSEMLYYSTSSISMAFVSENTTVGVMSFLAVLTSLVPFILAVTLSAEVNHLAGKFASLLRHSYSDQMQSWLDQQSEPPIPSTTSGNRMDNSAVSTMYIHNDLLMNNIGFQGLGFFTISYGMIGSIITTIATYSLLFIQLSEK